MIVTMLAIVPSIVLLIYIYKKDTKEKEPMKFLLGCFLLGALTAIPSIVVEELESLVLDAIATPGSFFYAVIEGFVVAALTEEFFKYLFLKGKSWKSKYFDCMFDGIVYAVFVGLGFATFENIFYVMDGGISTALLRMFTSIPGHTVFAVYMGYFYSKAKLADVKGDKAECRKNKKRALWIPVLLHGLYDTLIMFEEEQVGEGLLVTAVLIWIVYVIGLFIFTFIFVNKSSKNDDYIIVLPDGQTSIVNALNVGNWNCRCGCVNRGNFCIRCGNARPIVTQWKCPRCASDAYWNFCSNCGYQRSEE